MAKFLYNGPCDLCGSKDNRSNYSNGGWFCWGCKKVGKPDIPGFVTAAQEEEEEKSFTLPSDLTQDFPEAVVKFISQYEITIQELIKNAYFWSPFSGSLWRCFSSDLSGPTHAWADRRRVHPIVLGRDGKSSYGKSRFHGSKENAFAFTVPENPTPEREKSLCLTEDSLSAIKVGRVCKAMPLFGTHISTNKITKLVQEYGVQHAIVWLDRDKFREGWEIADKFKWLGIGSSVILTDKDPKYADEETIQKLVDK